jgi:hypothetical protein
LLLVFSGIINRSYLEQNIIDGFNWHFLTSDAIE